MTETEIIELALAEKFHQAEIIDTDKIVFDVAFRPYCEENLWLSVPSGRSRISHRRIN